MSLATKSKLLPPKLRDLFFKPGTHGRPVYIPSRYKVAYGGRGSAKSWGFAGAAAAFCTQKKLRILCAREFQTSIKDSIHQLICDRIIDLGLSEYFEITDKAIYGSNGSHIGFAGIKNDPGKIKGWDGADICLVEEADTVSKESWKFLTPTIRKPGSEIWVAFNPRDETDETYKKFVTRPMPASICRIVKMDWHDNPWFPVALKIEREMLIAAINECTEDDERSQLQADYDHIWEGACQTNSNASVFRRRVVTHAFEPPTEGTVFRFGADWGFANDPTALVRMWITTNDKRQEELWIDHEAFGYRVEIDETPQLFDSIPGARDWPIRADAARPETISYVARQGFNLAAAEKWPGSLEDGIAHVKSFVKIHIHTRCKHMQEEARLYAYKIDKVTGEVLPIVVDKNNHGWDAVRYGLDGIIQRRGAYDLWRRLGS